MMGRLAMSLHRLAFLVGYLQSRVRGGGVGGRKGKARGERCAVAKSGIGGECGQHPPTQRGKDEGDSVCASCLPT